MKPLDLGRLRAWSAVPAPVFVGGNQVELLEGGDALFPRMRQAIAEARQQVWLATYIFHDDPASQAMAEALMDAAARGLAVHVVVDGFGSIGTMDKVINWLTFYNHSRLHSKLQYVSSMTFEQRWIEDQQQDRKSTVCIPSAHTEANYYRHLARQASTVEVCIEPTTAHVEPTTAHGV